ncbi:MAG: hypothetical protein DHS20C13_08980 [Thermodesulfobacteriota bacterium]|nr:MAG: hypothetical protein DHS20C13_08980 [Thermodesulfobacteriota bacterium]
MLQKCSRNKAKLIFFIMKKTILVLIAVLAVLVLFGIKNRETSEINDNDLRKIHIQGMRTR